jgi:hypothetical protein
MSCALVLHPGGSVTDLTLPSTSHDRLALMYNTIGCQAVDVVRLTSQVDMWVDDEGLFTQPVNPVATTLARHYGYTWQPYHGPAILAGFDEDGNTTNLSRDQVVALLTRLCDTGGAAVLRLRGGNHDVG